ncbi:hypothetical protein GCM10022225_84980 [Plantactinospora mayteni]|uniref:Uncharacterized protein n=1 Tax=Plantactinospora mayteni TaxID=566021 RepID=A0ABQ4F3A7_9ACTN|nr:hypothetical protein [Plantactinospora mayteni]GIH01389.1 hypothetical protein Pma05_79610 [Plantactinospora mayteni]
MSTDGESARKSWDKVESRSDRFHSAFELKMKLPWPGPMKDSARNRMAEFDAKKTQLTNELTPLVSNPGSPIGLLAVGVAWETMKKQAELLVGEITASPQAAGKNGLKVDDFWKGDAAKAYQAILPDRQAALVGLREAAGIMREVLEEARGAINNLFIKVVAGLAGAIIGIGVAIATAGPGAAAGVGVVALGAALSIILPAMIDIQETMRTLKAQIEKIPAFTEYERYPGGHWPTLAAS